jgi:hypothetical protein
MGWAHEQCAQILFQTRSTSSKLTEAYPSPSREQGNQARQWPTRGARLEFSLSSGYKGSRQAEVFHLLSHFPPAEVSSHRPLTAG